MNIAISLKKYIYLQKSTNHNLKNDNFYYKMYYFVLFLTCVVGLRST